jgi:hypothetical protein
MNIFKDNMKSIKLSNNRIRYKYNDILLFNKIFNKKVIDLNTVKTKSVYKLAKNILKNTLMKKIRTKDEKNTKNLQKKIQKKLSNMKKKSVSEVLCLYSEILDLQRIDKFGLNL